MGWAGGPHHFHAGALQGRSNVVAAQRASPVPREPPVDRQNLDGCFSWKYFAVKTTKSFFIPMWLECDFSGMRTINKRRQIKKKDWLSQKARDKGCIILSEQCEEIWSWELKTEVNKKSHCLLIGGPFPEVEVAPPPPKGKVRQLAGGSAQS